MSRLTSVTPVLWILSFLVVGCTGPSQTKRDAPTFPAEYQRVVESAPIVRDASGHRLAHAFYGGLNTPRPQFVDIDGDGDSDLFLQEHSGRISFFEHVAEDDSTFLVWRTDDYRGIDVGEWFRFADLDGDGAPDLLAEQPYSHIRVYRNVGSATEPQFELSSDTLRTPDGTPIFSDRQNIPNVTDIDCDGRLDLFLGRLDGTITRYEAASDTAGMPVFAHVTDNFEGIEIVNRQIGVRHGANTLTFHDIDGDDDPDLFWGDFFEPGLLLIENTGSCGNPILSGEPEPFPPGNPLKTSGYNAPALTDWTGNGRLDLFVGVLGGSSNANASLADNFYFYEQTDTGYQLRTRQFVGGLDVGSESSVAIGDLDGDGILDGLIANKIDPKKGETSLVYRIRGRTSNEQPAYQLGDPLDLPNAYHYAPALGDLTGDGAADLVVGTWKGRLAYRPNDGAGGFASRPDTVFQLSQKRHAAPALGDVNDDGRLDLVVGAADGSVHLYRNTGSESQPSFASPSVVVPDTAVGTRSAPALFDADQDGTLDLLVGTEKNLYVVWNTGTSKRPAFAERPEPISMSGIPRLAVPAPADLDRDGDKDIVLGGERGGLVLLESQSQE